MKRKASKMSAVLAGILSLVLVACSGGGATTQEGASSPADGSPAPAAAADGADSGEKIQLTYTSWGSTNERQVTQAAIDSFMEANPHIEVTYTHIPDESGSYDTKLTTMAAAGQTPDAALFHGDLGLTWAAEGKVHNLLDFIQDDPDWDVDDIMPQAFYWYEEGFVAGINGAIEAFGIFYNKDMFEEAGLEAPPVKVEDAWTWDEFVDVSKSLTKDTSGRDAHDPDFDSNSIDQYGMTMGTWAFMQIVYGTGGSYLSADGTQFGLLEPEALEGLQQMSDLMNVHHVMPDPVAQKNLPNMATSLLSKKVAMAYEGQWALLDFDQAGLNFGVGVAPKAGNQFVTMTLGDPLMFFTESNHPQEAYQLLKWFWNPENTLELQTSGLWMPVLKEWYTDEEKVALWATGNSAHPEGYTDAILDAALGYGVPSQGYTVRNLPKISAIVDPALDRVWLGDVTAEEAMNEIKNQVQSEIQGLYYRP